MSKDKVVEHYNRLIQTTIDRIAQMRKENVHFSTIDEELDYLHELYRRLFNLIGQESTTQECEIHGFKNVC